MWKEFASLFTLWGSVSRRRYLLWGVSLFVIKYTIDWLVATQFMGREWSPLRYLIWPDGNAVFILDLPVADQRFAMVMLAIALPFICIGVILTLQRLRDAGMPRWLVLLFFVPMVNLLLIAWLCMVPSQQSEQLRKADARKARQAEASEGSARGFWLASVISSVISALLMLLSANVLKSYGFGVFVLLPFANGWLAAILYGLPVRRTWGQCVAVGLTSLGLSAAMILLFAIEGLLCLLMLAPLAVALGFLGATVGYAFQWRHWVEHNTPALILSMLVIIPSLMAAESQSLPEPALSMTRTEVIINAPPEVVWKYVTTFQPLPEPTEWFFKLGIAHPLRAEIVGTGVGAIRYCIFSTGAFVEPITGWDEPRRLAFEVQQQPCPMVELSLFDVHPPHLDHFLVSRRGEFLLEQLPNGGTRLIGTTWYTNKMWPAMYWELWSNHLIGQIHRRVLEHVKRCAEEGRVLKQ